MSDARAIGVFDSGVGGLTVLRALRQAMPFERFVYLGDTARLPYGAKSADTVSRYALQCAVNLRRYDVKSLVIACNTASAVALPALREALGGMPVIGVLEPGAQAAAATSATGKIAVLATEGTVRGGAYERAIKTFNSHAQVLSLACPLLVALAEEGLVSGPIVELVARRYLAPIAVTPVDTVVLGCTHFPVFLPVLQSLLTPEHRWVDSAATTALAVRATLASLRLLAQEGLADPRAVRFLATDGAERFARVGSLFYGEAIPESAVEVVDLA